MQEKQNTSLLIIIYVVVFGVITGGIMLLNTMFVNIFAFDFSPVNNEPKTKKEVVEENYSAYMDSVSRKLRMEILDSLKMYSGMMKDSAISRIDSTMTDSLNKLKAALAKNVSEDSVHKVVRDFTEKTKSDTLYKNWAKKTAVLYEAMEPKKAAKIIQNYSDNIARDILYLMKKKKAADILTNLSPELANRITRIR